jgi:nitrate/nitrite transport system ATP-binding protein
LALAKDTKYNQYRSAVLTFLYEKQRKVESLSSADKSTKKQKAASEVA